MDPGRLYRLQSSNVIEMELTARPVFGFLLPERPAGGGYRVEYVDPSTGWETWQSLDEVSAGTPRRWYADPTQAPLTPRFYRLVPLP